MKRLLVLLAILLAAPGWAAVGAISEIATAEIDDNAGFTGQSTPSFTPSGDAMLLVHFAVSRAGGSTDIVTVTTTGISLANACQSIVDMSSAEAEPLDMEVWACITASSPGTGTIDFTTDEDGGLGKVRVYEVTADNAFEFPPTNIGTNPQADTASATVSLPGASSADNSLLGVSAGYLATITGAPTQAPGWTALEAGDYNAPVLIIGSYVDGSDGGPFDPTYNDAQDVIHSAIIDIAEASAGDSTAPTCGTAPAEDSNTDTSTTVDATCSDETDSTVDHYWAVTANDATDPTPTELRLNTYGGTFIDRDASDAGVTNGVESQVTLTGLSASTAYDVFHTVCDSSDNCKDVVQIDITTDAATVPAISSTTLLQAGKDLTITGTDFGASQGSGSVVLSPANDIDDANAETQTISSWGDTSITTTGLALPTGVVAGDTVYLFVTDGSAGESTGFQTEIADPALVLDFQPLRDTDSDGLIGIASAEIIALCGAAGTRTLTMQDDDFAVVDGVVEIVDAAFSIDEIDDTCWVGLIESATRAGFFPATVVDRNP